MREPDEVLQLVLFACWVLDTMRTVNAFTLLGSTVMREATHDRMGAGLPKVAGDSTPRP